jgi:DNA topoisomerase-1
MNVVIVESAAKAKTINKYLGSKYKVLASYGHVRDLPSKDGSVEPDKDFQMHWDVDGKSQKIMKEIADAVKNADKLILATDPDREGEAISWHILDILEKRKAIRKGLPVERVTFNAVTKQSVLDAFKSPRSIDAPLVDSYLARRALDYLVGFTLSPVLWRKLPGARSAGRVQSVALRLVCDREADIEAFKSEEYWTIEALLATARAERFGARLTAIAGRKLDKLDIKDAASANAIKAAIEGGAFSVTSVEKKAVRRNPYAPFTTSTLQQEASRKLGFSAKHTMQVAQRSTRASRSTAMSPASSPTCGPTASPSSPRRSTPSVPWSSRIIPGATCRPSSASTRSRPKTRRRRTRRSVRPTCAAGPTRWRAIWSATRPASTS